MTFQTGKKISTISSPGKFEITTRPHKGNVCREGLGSTCADDSKLLTGFCLIAYSSNQPKNGRKAAQRTGRTSACRAKLWETSFALLQGQWKFVSQKSTSYQMQVPYKFHPKANWRGVHLIRRQSISYQLYRALYVYVCDKSISH